ncbi:MAG: hypothetical protein AB8G14_12730 [Ilumatobacter sp.]
MGAGLPIGGDADRLLDVETRLRIEIVDIDNLLTGHIANARALVPDAAVSLEHAASLATTFCQETGIVADAVLGVRQALGFADGTPINLDTVRFWLGHSLTDSDGAVDAPATRFEDLAQRAFGDGPRPDGLELVEGLVDQALNDTDLVAIWGALPETTRVELLKDRPDLGLAFLGAGALSTVELDQLSRSTLYTVGSTKLEIAVGLELKAKIFTVTLGGGVSVTIERLSDGSFKMLVGTNAYVGVARELELRGVEVSAELRAIIESGQVMQFADEQQLLEAIDTLEQAIADDASDWFGTGRNVLGHVVDSNIFLSPFGAARWLGVPTPGQVIAGDQRPESIKALEALMNEHGASTRVAAGVEGSASAELDAVGLGGLEASGKISLVVYHVDGLNGGSDSTGVVLAGSLTGSFTQDDTPLVPGTSNADITGGGTIGFSSDTSVDEHGNIVNVTTLYVETNIGTVGSLGLGNTVLDSDNNPVGSSVTLEQSNQVSQRHTVTIKTPVNADTDDLVANAATGLAGGDLQGVLDLYDAADVVVTSEDGVQVATTATVDAKVVEVQVSITATDTVTTSSTHKPAGGEAYDQIAANEQIDAAQLQLESVAASNADTAGPAGGGGGGSSTSWFTPSQTSSTPTTSSPATSGSSTSHPDWFTPSEG